MKKKQVNNTQLDFEFKASNAEEYEVDSIQNSAVYARKSARQLSGLYYLVSWKGYPKKENTWKLVLAIQHLWRHITAYYKDNLEKPTTASVPIITAPPMAKSTALLMLRPTAAPTKKRGRPAKSITITTKQAKKS